MRGLNMAANSMTLLDRSVLPNITEPVDSAACTLSETKAKNSITYRRNGHKTGRFEHTSAQPEDIILDHDTPAAPETCSPDTQADMLKLSGAIDMLCNAKDQKMLQLNAHEDDSASPPPICNSIPPRKLTRSSRIAQADLNMQSAALMASTIDERRTTVPKKSTRVRIKKEAVD